MIDEGTAYRLPVPEYDPALVEVEAGTPAGELLRRYWHPFALSSDATDTPRPVRILGEDLIVFRDGRGDVGLVHPRCCHRGTTLYYGKVEDDGIRCCYHGWLFAPDGRCLDMPVEVDRGRRKDQYRLPRLNLAPPLVKQLECTKSIGSSAPDLIESATAPAVAAVSKELQAEARTAREAVDCRLRASSVGMV